MPEFSPAQVMVWLRRILGHEGGFTLNRADAGNWTGGEVALGELRGTRWGISAASYPGLDIRNLTVEAAEAIYRVDFVHPLRLGRYRDGVAFQLFDLAVNSGPGRAIRLLQKALGVLDDGKVGPQTLGALRARSESDVVMLVLAERLEFMAGLSNWPDFGRGWARRIAENLRHGAMDTD